MDVVQRADGGWYVVDEQGNNLKGPFVSSDEAWRNLLIAGTETETAAIVRNKAALVIFHRAREQSGFHVAVQADKDFRAFYSTSVGTERLTAFNASEDAQDALIKTAARTVADAQRKQRATRFKEEFDRWVINNIRLGYAEAPAGSSKASEYAKLLNEVSKAEPALAVLFENFYQDQVAAIGIPKQEILDTQLTLSLAEFFQRSGDAQLRALGVKADSGILTNEALGARWIAARLPLAQAAARDERNEKDFNKEYKRALDEIDVLLGKPGLDDKTFSGLTDARAEFVEKSIQAAEDYKMARRLGATVSATDAVNAAISLALLTSLAGTPFWNTVGANPAQTFRAIRQQADIAVKRAEIEARHIIDPRTGMPNFDLEAALADAEGPLTAAAIAAKHAKIEAAGRKIGAAEQRKAVLTQASKLPGAEFDLEAALKFAADNPDLTVGDIISHFQAASRLATQGE